MNQELGTTSVRRSVMTMMQVVAAHAQVQAVAQQEQILSAVFCVAIPRTEVVVVAVGIDSDCVDTSSCYTISQCTWPLDSGVRPPSRPFPTPRVVATILPAAVNSQSWC